LGRLPAAKREALRAARLRDFDSLGPIEFAKQRSRGSLGRNAGEEIFAASVRISEQVSPSAYRHAWEMMVGADILPYAQKIRVPTLIISGSDDPVAPPAACAELAQVIPGAKLSQVDGVGHNVMLEATDRFERLYRDFLGDALTSRGQTS
jgi:pimeloyl-ACP methyl ester carboxylesterase